MPHTRWGAAAAIAAAALVLLGGLIAACSGALGQEGPVPFAQTQAGMNQQAYRDFVAADQAMNRAYKRLLAQLDKSRQAKQPMVYSGARAQKRWRGPNSSKPASTS